MRNLKILPLILLFALMLSCFSPAALALEDPAVNSNAVLIMETDSRTILFSQNENARVYPASTTKIMTVLLAIEAVEEGKVHLTDNVTATANMNYDMIPDGSSAGIQVGETMTLQDLLYCAMLASGNDACNVIAEYIGGSIGEFVEMMNKRAQELGCVGTHFANTHGLPHENHYTTAWDFAQISLEAMTHSEFMEISDTISYEIAPTNMSGRRVLTNTNGLINENSPLYPGYKYEYAHGVKTGYTSAAGYCLVSTAVKDGVQLLCIIMGGTVVDNNGIVSYSNFLDSKNLYEWGFENFSFQNILDLNDVVTTADVVMGSNGDVVALKPQNTITAFLPNDTLMDSFEMDIKINTGEDGVALQAPIAMGDVLGEVTVTKDGVNYGTVKLVAASSVELSRINFIKASVVEFITQTWVKVAAGVLVALLVIYILLVVHYRSRRRKYIRQMRAKQAAERKRKAEAMAQTRQEFSSQRPTATVTSDSHRGADKEYFDEFFKK